ncbi:MAG: ATP-grasp domain-containing protein [Coriobacteriales bacterium]|nr:ATP-grasp domain-containing protein [Coriobacteriales bacterium]
MSHSDDVWILAANHVMARALEVDRWVEVFANHGIRLVPQLSCELRLFASDKGLALSSLTGERLLASRTCIARVYEPEVPRQLELLGTSCQPSSRMVSLCFDKAIVSQLVATTGVPMIATEIVPRFTSEHVAQRRFELPAVVKPACGRGGDEVELVRSQGELSYHLDQLIGRPGVVQQVVDTGRDVRVYVIGGEPRYAMERLGKPGDFRSNYSTGGTARPYELTAELDAYTRKILSALPETLAFGSVDFCFAEGSPVFCELNANLGCRIPYEFGGFDLIGDYAQWFKQTCR